MRAGTTQSDPECGRQLQLDRPQVVPRRRCARHLPELLAQAPDGYRAPAAGCLPDGARNRMFLQRLRTSSAATHAFERGQIRQCRRVAGGRGGRGVPTIIEMGQPHPAGPRFLGGATSMRGLTARPPCPASEGVRRLIDQPLMRNVLADLAVEGRGRHTIVAMRIAGATDNALRNGDQALLRRVGLAAAKVLGVQERSTTPPKRWSAPGRQRLCRDSGCPGSTRRRG